MILLNKDAAYDTKVWASESFAYRLLRNTNPSAYKLILGSIATHLTKMIQDALPHYWAITNTRWDAERLLRDHGNIADVAFMSLLSVILLSNPWLANCNPDSSYLSVCGPMRYRGTSPCIKGPYNDMAG